MQELFRTPRPGRIADPFEVCTIPVITSTNSRQGTGKPTAERARVIIVGLDGMTSATAVRSESVLVIMSTRERLNDLTGMPGAIAAIRRAGEAAGHEIGHAAFLSRCRRLSDGHAARQLAAKLETIEGVPAARDARRARHPRGASCGWRWSRACPKERPEFGELILRDERRRERP